jgi:hypothetical protein
MREFRIAVFPGDGIGREVMAPCLTLLDIAVARSGGFRLAFDQYEAGAELYRQTGTALPDSAMRAAESADAILLGAMGLPEVRYPDGTEVQPHLDFPRTVRSLCRRAPVPVVERRANAAGRSAREEHRLRAGARVDRGPVRLADHDTPRGQRSGVRHDAHHAAHVRTALRLCVSTRPVAAEEEAGRAA